MAPDGTAIVYTASVAGARQIRVVQLPTGPSKRIAASNAEEYGADRLAERQARLRLDAQRRSGRSTSRSRTAWARPLRHDAAGDAVHRRARPRLVARRNEARVCAPVSPTARARSWSTTERRRRFSRAAISRLVASRHAHRVRKRRESHVGRAGRHGRAPARHRRPTRLARRARRSAEVPEPRAAAAERARARGRRARPLAARLHVDGRQPRPGNPVDPGNAARRART